MGRPCPEGFNQASEGVVVRDCTVGSKEGQIHNAGSLQLGFSRLDGGGPLGGGGVEGWGLGWAWSARFEGGCVGEHGWFTIAEDVRRQ